MSGLFIRLQQGATFVTAIMVVAPAALVSAFAFNAAERGMTWQGFSLQWFGRCLREPQLRDAISRSLAVAGIVSSASLGLGITAAYGLSGLCPRRQRLGLATVVAVLGCPDLALSIAQADAIRALRLDPGIHHVAFGQIPYATGYVILATMATASSARVERYVRAAEDLGASPWRSLWHVYAPMTRRGWLAGGSIAFALSFQDVVFSAQLGGAGNTTLGLRLYGMLRRGVSPEINMVFLMTLVLVAAIVLALPSSNPEEEQQS